jgi:hypothetical protein
MLILSDRSAMAITVTCRTSRENKENKGQALKQLVCGSPHAQREFPQGSAPGAD